MPDLGHDIQLGLFPTPRADALPQLLELVQLAEVSGVDVVSIQDHPYQRDFVDTWTLLSFLGARTSTIRLAPNVASLPLRPPAVLAKSAASLDLLTGGRVELGLGTGAFWDAIVAAGGPRRSPKEAVDALVEALRIIRAVWAGESVREDGEHYQVVGFRGGPRPAHDIPIWFGAYKPRMLRLTGQLADGWVPSMGYADPPALPELSAAVDAAAVKAGRDPRDIRRIYNIFGSFGRGGGFLKGTPDQWAEELADLATTTGMSTFVLGTDDPDTLRRFADEVGPSLRDLVEQRRSAPQTALPTGQATAPEHPATGVPRGDEPQPLQVTATADDGTRLRPELPWDEASRPTLPKPDDARYPLAQQAAPQHLVDIHDGLRAELEQVRSIVDQVREGHLSVGAARSVINTMTMRQNNWTLGAYCESYCRIVTGHHTLEDRSVFPHLQRSQPDLEPVLNQLQEEHEVIADVLDQLDRALVGLVEAEGYGQAGRDALARLGESVDLLTDTLLSHLAYEERELMHPLAAHGFG